MNQPGWRLVRQWLAGKIPSPRRASAPLLPLAIPPVRAFVTTQTLVRAYYAGLLYLAFTGMPTSMESGSGSGDLALLWPVVWIKATGMGLGILVVMSLYLGGAIAAVVAPGNRLCRTLAALGLLEFTALTYSGGKIGHGSHLWVLTAIILVFLPETDPQSTRRERQAYLNVFWTAHALVLLTYTMAGLGKLAGALYQFSQGEVTVFHPSAMALHVADRLVETGSSSSAGRWLVDHTWVGWPLMLGTIYLQTFAFWSIFRPRLIRLWTIGLIAFHLATFFVLTIRFAPPVLLLGMWGLASPFAPDTVKIEETLLDLPLFGLIWRWLRRRSG